VAQSSQQPPSRVDHRSAPPGANLATKASVTPACFVWYAPAVGASVREEKDAEYLERGDEMDGSGTIRAQHTLLELVSYTPGRGSQMTG